MFIFMDLRGESLSSQSTIPAKIQKGSLRPVGVSEETSRGGVFGIYRMHVVLRPGHWSMLFSKIWFATVESFSMQFLPLGMAGEQKLGEEILQDIHQIT